MSGKGDDRRPMVITDARFRVNWANTFGGIMPEGMLTTYSGREQHVPEDDDVAEVLKDIAAVEGADAVPAVEGADADTSADEDG